MTLQVTSLSTRLFPVRAAGAIAALLAGGLTFGVPTAQAQAAGDVILPTDVTSTPTVPGGSTTVPSSGTGTTGTTVPTETGSVPLNGVRFFCQNNAGQPTVMYQPESQPNRAYPWAVPSAMGGGWSPEARCQEIARRLETYRPDGLTEMTTAVENGLNTICVTTDRVPNCRIVLTVPNGQDPIATRDRIFDNLASADDGQMTQGVRTLRSTGGSDIFGQIGNVLGMPGLGGNVAQPRSTGINLRPFLDRADGGTGAKLTGGVAYTRPATPAATTAKPAEVKPAVVKPAETKKPTRRFNIRRIR